MNQRYVVKCIQDAECFLDESLMRLNRVDFAEAELQIQAAKAELEKAHQELMGFTQDGSAAEAWRELDQLGAKFEVEVPQWRQQVEAGPGADPLLVATALRCSILVTLARQALALGLTLAEVASRSGISEGKVEGFFRGKSELSLSDIQRVSMALGLKMSLGVARPSGHNTPAG